LAPGPQEGCLPQQEGKIPAPRVPEPERPPGPPPPIWPTLISPPPPQPVATGGRGRSRRRLLLIVGAVAVLVVAAVVAALLFSGAFGTNALVGGEPRRPAPTTAPPPTPTPDRAPLDVRLRDDRTSILVSWTEPAAGPAPVVIAIARDQQPATIVTTLAPGTREYTLDKLDPAANYCVILAAVYPGETSSAATSVCTTR
jgi:hypothetical protein